MDNKKETKPKQAIALEYDPSQDAPKVVASGRGLLAERILEKAKEANVPIHKDTKLSDTLSRLEIGDFAAETRSKNQQKLQAQCDHMIQCLQDACQAHGATLEGGLSKAYSAYSFSEDAPLVQHVVSACHKAGIPPVLGASGGGSDANNMNRNGVEAVVLGTGMAKVHTTNEELSIANLENTAALTLALATLL